MLSLSYPEGGALVVGGAGNVGAGVTRRLAQAGLPVVFTYSHNAERARTIENDLRGRGLAAFAQRMDMKDVGSIKTAIDVVIEKAGRLHTLANAGGPFIAINKIGDLSVEEVASFLNEDAMGAFRLVHAALPVMRASGGGTITLCTTIANRRVIQYDGISPFSKGAVEALVRQIAYEEAANGIRCNAVPIAWVAEFGVEAALEFLKAHPQRDMFAAILRQMESMVLSHQPQHPDQAGNLYAFLASDQAACITGQSIAFDGGAAL